MVDPMFIAIVATALLLIVAVPLLHASGLISDFRLSLWGKYLCYALLAISVDLLWGYTGLLSLGQGRPIIDQAAGAGCLGSGDIGRQI